MKKGTKAWLITATAMCAAGLLIFGGVFAVLHWDFSKLATTVQVTNEHMLTEPFTGITINTDTADIVLVPCEAGECRVVCQEPQNATHSVAVVDGVLNIAENDNRKWYEHISIGVGQGTKVTIYMPQGEYAALSIREHTGDIEIPSDFSFESIDIHTTTGDVSCRADAAGKINIKTSTGDILVEGISAAALELSVTTGTVRAANVHCTGDVAVSVDTGKVTLSDVSCQNLRSDGDTGDLIMSNVVAIGKFSIECGTGDVKFDGCDAAELRVHTDTGDVKGSLLTEKVFVVDTGTGKKDVPKTTSGGLCEITTGTGDVRITIH